MILYHGTRIKLPSLASGSCLNEGSYLTPFIWAARLFAVEWSSSEVLGVDPNKPGEILRFKGKAPKGYPIYIYHVDVNSSVIRKADTNMAKPYPYNYRITHNVLAYMSERHDDWRELLPFTEDEENWLR